MQKSTENRKINKEPLPLEVMREITRKLRRQKCKTCRKSFFKISQHGNCVNCAKEKVSLARLQIKHKEGPIYEKWKQKMFQALSEKM